MRVLVCGGRDFSDREWLFRALDSLPITQLCHGNARGADRLAGEWAHSRRVPYEAHPAAWALHGKRAGPIRNCKMLNEFKPDAVIAFPGGTGTADMCDQATRAGVLVLPQV